MTSGGSCDQKSCCSSSKDLTGTRTTPCGASRSSDDHHDKAESRPGTTLCLAVVRENGTEVVLFDASGVPRTFHYNGDIHKLCFSTHGAADTDELLTPCLDQYGNHGLPQQSCFCGVPTPHMHAHVRDPQTCTEDQETLEANVAYLAAQILLPANEEKMLNIGVSERMPSECNSQQVLKRMKQNRYRRMHKIRHEDHDDFLVHNDVTGELHLEHTCDTCGDSDVHGRFQSLGSRRLKRKGDDIQIRFFQIAPNRFNVLDFVAQSVDLDSDRVMAAQPIVETSGKRSPRRLSSKSTSASKIAPDSAAAPKRTVRTTLTCNKICCTAEVPMVNSVIEPLPGVEKVMINVPLKQVIVQHDPSVTTAQQIVNALNKRHFGATLKHDGAEAQSAQSGAASKGRSQFHVGGICCSSEIPAVNSIVEPLKGVHTVSINVTTKTVYVDHDYAIVSAQEICDALNREKFGAEIRKDAASVGAIRTTFVHSSFSYENINPDVDALTVLFSSYDSSQIESFIVDATNKRISVVHNPLSLTAQGIVDALESKLAIPATIVSDGADPDLYLSLIEKSKEQDMDEEQVDDSSFTFPRPTVILAGFFWVVAMLSYIGDNWEALKYLGLASIVCGLPPIAMKAFRTLQRYQFDTNCLMTFASLGAVALQDYPEAAAVVFLFAVSEWLEVRATSRARQALSAIVNLRPDIAQIILPSTNEIITIPASSVPIGALVSVRTGDKVPCDGVVVNGSSTVDESSLTGESRPIRKAPNDKVSGGTINSGMTPLTIRTTSTADNSAVARLIRLVEEAQANRSETEKLIDEFAKIYTPIVVIAAILMCSIPWAFGSDEGSKWTNNGLVLIVVACPCALIISTPVSYVAGLAATAQKGILIKGGAFLEVLGVAKNICFDKTGTLTKGEFALIGLTEVGNRYTRKEIFQYLSLMEQPASHPLAQAILLAAKNEGVSIPHNMVLDQHKIIAGEGVTGVINGINVHVGNERMMERLQLVNTLSSEILDQISSWKSIGGTVGFMSIDGAGIVCAFCAADAVKPEAAAVVRNLKNRGISITMLTGDNRDAAHVVGSQIGLDVADIKAELLPEEKLDFISSFNKRSSRGSSLFCPFTHRDFVIMCGDGVNDAAALAASDVGIALGSGAALAMETADVTLLDNNLEKLEYCMEMGRRVIRKIRENVVFSLLVKLTVLAFAVAGKTQLWAAIASDVGAMILVTLNSMMLLPSQQRKLRKDVCDADVEKGADLKDGYDFRAGTRPSGLIVGSVDDRTESKATENRRNENTASTGDPCCSNNREQNESSVCGKSGGRDHAHNNAHAEKHVSENVHHSHYHEHNDNAHSMDDDKSCGQQCSDHGNVSNPELIRTSCHNSTDNGTSTDTRASGTCCSTDNGTSTDTRASGTCCSSDRGGVCHKQT